MEPIVICGLRVEGAEWYPRPPRIIVGARLAVESDDPPTDEGGAFVCGRRPTPHGLVVTEHWIMRDRGGGYDVCDYTVEYLVPGDGHAAYRGTRWPAESVVGAWRILHWTDDVDRTTYTAYLPLDAVWTAGDAGINAPSDLSGAPEGEGP